MIINTGMRTDIPAFYTPWFLNRLREGFVLVRNPYRPEQVTRYRLSPDVVDLIGFCTKDPEPLLPHLDALEPYGQYWFVTITPYGRDIEPGVPLKQVQRLCDIHSALFHGAAQEDPAARGLGDRHVRAADLAAIPGHPLHTLTGENEILGRWIQEARERLASRENLEGILERIREVAVHYAKKGDLLYPLLNVGHGLPGPSEVMWTVDDEIRDELKAVCTSPSRDKAWEGRLQAVLQRVEEMIFKENNILFPICAANFTDEEWRQIYRDSQDYEPCLGTVGENWPEGEGQGNLPGMAATEGEIVMPGGHLTLPQLTALLNTLPVEISFVDGDNINRFFNEGPKVFKRPAMAIDQDVFSCHPPKIQPIVRAIIGDFRSGRQDSVPVWMEKNGRTYLVTYMAVRDSQKNYLGTLEVVQDMEAAKAHFGK